ncbi:MAG: metal ABC transporter permease [Moraxella osloensis]
MLFAAVDPQVAQAQHLNLTFLSLLFMFALSLVVAVSVQFIGAFTLRYYHYSCLAAAASQVTARPIYVYLLSMLFAIAAGVSGILLSLGPDCRFHLISLPFHL